MRAIGIVLSIFLLIICFNGCSKDEDAVAELEQDALESQTTDYLDETPAEETASPMEEVPETPETAMTPETAPVEEPIEMPSQPEGEGYTIQVAAGTNPAYARYLAGIFMDRGYEAFVTEAIIDGETFYRIRVGNYATLTEARNAGTEIQDKFSTDFWIDNNI